MADRELARPCTLYADLPGLGSEAVRVSVADPTGRAIATSQPATPLGSGRYRFQLAEPPAVPGIWRASWERPDGTSTVERFTVGERPTDAITRWQLRLNVMSRLEPVVFGTVALANAGQIADAGMRGGEGNYVGWWLLMAPDGFNDGVSRRVIGFAAGSLELEAPLPATPQPGARYALFRVDPEELDLAIDTAFTDIAAGAHIPLAIPGIRRASQSAQRLPIPDSFATLHQVWRESLNPGTESELTRLAPTLWELYPGRQLRLSSELGEHESLTLIGTRLARLPRWDDSLVEIDPQVLIARAAMNLHASRSAGSGRDLDEHLRRQFGAQDEFERAARRDIGRLPNGSRFVLS